MVAKVERTKMTAKAQSPERKEGVPLEGERQLMEPRPLPPASPPRRRRKGNIIEYVSMQPVIP